MSIEIRPLADGAEEFEYAPVPQGFHRGCHHNSREVTKHKGAKLCLFVVADERGCDRWWHLLAFFETRLGPALKQIPSLDQRAHLAIRHTALQHPKSAVGMDVAQTLRT